MESNNKYSPPHNRKKKGRNFSYQTILEEQGQEKKRRKKTVEGIRGIGREFFINWDAP